MISGSFPQSTEKVPLFPKRLKPKTRSESPLHSFLTYWSRWLLSRLLSGCSLPPWSAHVWGRCCHPHACNFPLWEPGPLRTAVASSAGTSSKGQAMEAAADPGLGALSLCVCAWIPKEKKGHVRDRRSHDVLQELPGHTSQRAAQRVRWGPASRTCHKLVQIRLAKGERWGNLCPPSV